MIARIWHGRVPTGKARAYRTFLNERAIPDYRSVEGNIAVYVLEREEGEVTHFVTLTFWESMDAIRSLAGDDPELAKYYPEDKDFLLEFEPRVVHYEVVEKSQSEPILDFGRSLLPRWTGRAPGCDMRHTRWPTLVAAREARKRCGHARVVRDRGCPYARRRYAMRCAGLAVLIGITLFGPAAFSSSWDELAPPVIDGIWVRPAQTGPAQPVWGHADGLRIGLWPMPGPRGLLRVYAPYLGHPDGRMINYIAVEPIVRGVPYRGLSEMEKSTIDGVQGKRFWSGDSPEDRIVRDPTYPAAGVVGREGGIKTLTVYIFVEPFENGAEVYLKLTFRSDRPYEVGIATFAAPDSAPLDYCIVTATMGNYARLRRIYLRDRVVSSLDLWPDYRGLGFTDRVEFPLQALPRSPTGAALFIAAPDEEDPESAQYAPRTFIGWRYYGDVATQYWRCEDTGDDLVGAVNGRYVYWNSESPIPGGVAIENFELIRPFAQGTEYWFGVTPEPPESLLNRDPLLSG